MHKILILVPVIPVPVQAQRLDSAYPKEEEEEEVLLVFIWANVILDVLNSFTT